MKFLSAILLLLSFSTVTTAQSQMDEQIELVRQSAHADRKGMILDNVQISADESDAFWTAWDAYRGQMARNDDRRLALIKNFADRYSNMDNMIASELLTDSFSIEMQGITIMQGFAQKISVFMPAKKVMRIIQIENKVNAAIEMQLASEIPLAK